MKKNIIIVVLLVIAVAALVGIKKKKMRVAGSTSCPGGVCTLPIPAGRPLFEDRKVAIASQEKALPEMVVLHSPDCPSCREMAPILAEMQTTFSGQLSFELIDVMENREAEQQFGIFATPTVVFFDPEGTELFRHTGFFSRAEMLAKWQELGVALTDESQDSSNQ